MRVIGAIALSGCFQATAALGVPCSEDGACPSNQVCDRMHDPPLCVDHLADAGIPDGADAATLTISGTVNYGKEPVASAIVAAFATANESQALAAATTDDRGAFALTVAKPFDGFLSVTAGEYVASYIYAAGTLDSDLADLVLPLVTASALDNLYAATGVGNETRASIALQVVDAAGQSVRGVAVFSQPAAPDRYNRNNLPSNSATTTDTDGIAYLLNVVPSTQVTVAGGQCTPHDVKARPGTLTITMLVAPVAPDALARNEVAQLPGL